MVKCMSLILAVGVLFFSALVFAHGSGTHIMGTVAVLDAQHVVVTTRDGKTIFIRLTAETTYRKGTAAATGADLKVGNRVAVEATGKEDSLTASEIQFSSGGEEMGHEGMLHHQMHEEGK